MKKQNSKSKPDHAPDDAHSAAKDLIAANGFVSYYETMWQQRLMEGGPSYGAWALSQLRIARKYADQARRRATMEFRRKPPPLYPSPCCKAESKLRGIYHGIVFMRCSACADYWERPVAPAPKLVYTAPEPLELRERRAPHLCLA